MATAVKNLTKMGTDVRKIAALLRAKAPEGHMLAYISPEEAQVLKDRGGSGKPHADTGIPSFELDDNLAIAGASPATEPSTGVGQEGAITGDFGGAGGYFTSWGSISAINPNVATSTYTPVDREFI